MKIAHRFIGGISGVINTQSVKRTADRSGCKDSVVGIADLLLYCCLSQH
jgi:hypothetical protein